jgi:hypothetical protein
MYDKFCEFLPDLFFKKPFSATPARRLGFNAGRSQSRI